MRTDEEEEGARRKIKEEEEEVTFVNDDFFSHWTFSSPTERPEKYQGPFGIILESPLPCYGIY